MEQGRCAYCAQYYRGKPPRQAGLRPQVSGTAWSKASVDITGTHPRLRTGCEYILTALDHFTKWADALPIRDHKAHTVEKVLLDRLFSRFGMPEELLSDQGLEFESELVAEWCKALGVRKIRTIPYRPTTSGMLERIHRTLNQTIGKVVSEGQRDWDQYIQPVMAAYRASKHVVTGFSPNFLMLGREVRAPIDLVLGRPVEEVDYWQSTNEFVTVVQERYRRAYEIARKSLQLEAKRRKDLYDRRVVQRRFPVGTWIWYY